MEGEGQPSQSKDSVWRFMLNGMGLSVGRDWPDHVWQRRKLRLPWRRKGHKMRLQHILFQWSERCFPSVCVKSRERRNWIILCCQLSYMRLATLYCWLLLETDASYLRIKWGFTCWCKLWFSSQSNYQVIQIICSSQTVFHTKKKELSDVTQHCLFIFSMWNSKLELHSPFLPY